MGVSIQKNLLLAMVLIWVCACTKSPEYPSTPQIEFVEAKKITLAGGIDSLYIKLKFKDGDGDLGLNENDAPNVEYVIGDTVRNLPLDEYDCLNFIKSPGDRDTIRIIRNPDYFNFFVTFYRKNSNNTYTIINDIECLQNNGRFSRFDPDDNYNGPLEGFIEYNFKGSFSILFRNQTLQIGIQIKDRALHWSNPVRTQDIKF